MADLIEEFSEGKVQFAYVKVRDPNTGLPKTALIAWCGEGVPERTKGYFTSHLATVSRLLHGYHVQITARADGDLTPEGIIQKVADSSGSKYSVGPEAQAAAPSPAPRPPTASKPVFTPSRNVGAPPPPASFSKPASYKGNTADDDGWGPDAPPVTRTELEKVQPAYKPTKVDLHELRSGQPSAGPENGTGAGNDRSGDVVKGGYQPVGKVDIAAIRRQAHEAGELKDDRPEPVKSTYEPVGKVDIAAIRARAQKPSEPEPKPLGTDERPSIAERSAAFTASERLTSLPKPKVVNRFGAAMSTFSGTKPPVPGSPVSSNPVAANVASRTFADEGGKTPAQLWAERKAKERASSGDASTHAASSAAGGIIQSQPSGRGEWKSSYTGKHWTPVQTTHTGMSLGSNASQKQVDVPASDGVEDHRGVNELRNQFAHLDTKGPSESPLDRRVPIPNLPSGPTTQKQYESDARQPMPPPPQQPRSPTPPTPPERESSPIRVAAPVGRTVADAHDEQRGPPQALPVQSLEQVVPNEDNIEDDASRDIGRATAEATVSGGEGSRALVQYDYEKAEDNEIELKEGEYVTDIEMVDKDWWVGVNTSGERGLFPSNYVEVVENDQPQEAAPVPLPEPESETVLEAPAPAGDGTTTIAAAGANVAVPSAGKGNGSTATALYDYEAAEDNEIGFPEGVKIINIVCGSSPLLSLLLLTVLTRNSPMMIGGLGSTTVRRVYSLPTMCSLMNEHLRPARFLGEREGCR